MKINKHPYPIAIAIFLAVCLAAHRADARTILKSICRLKGQEENTLQGLGIVVGLKGTGDGSSFLPTLRSLEKVMRVMGEPLGRKSLDEIKDTKNVALVTVTAVIPAAGPRQGDKIDCVVSSIGSAKSLAGGRLFLTPLVGPDRTNPRVYAFAEGPITLDDPSITNTGRVFEGCQLEEEFFNAFIKDRKITLVLDKNHADFQVAQDVAELINGRLGIQSRRRPAGQGHQPGKRGSLHSPPVPRGSRAFCVQVLSLPIMEPQTAPRVVINERAGSIVISGDVEIGAAVVSHKNIVVETGDAGNARPFVPVNPADPNAPKLKALVETLNALHVATPDVIDIIKGLDRNGRLHAQLIIE